MAQLNLGGDPTQPSAGVTILDWWKATALLLVFVDHYGHFIDPDETLWRAIGRSSLPIWVFLIGFGRGRNVPVSWWLLGALITALDAYTSDKWSDVQINILINFGLMRLALPAIERHVLGSPLRVAALAVGLAVINPWTSGLIEYGADAWVLMLVGALHRRWLETGDRNELWKRLALAAFGAVAYMATEARDYDFEDTDLLLMVGGVALVVAGLVFVRRGPSPFDPWRLLAAPLRFLGRYTLELYAAHLVALQVIGGVLQLV